VAVRSEGDQYRSVLNLHAACGQLLQDKREDTGGGGVAGIIVDEQQRRIPLLHHVLQPGGGDRFGKSSSYFVKISSRRGRRSSGSEHRQKVLVGNHHIAETVIGKGDSSHGAPPSRFFRGIVVSAFRFCSDRKRIAGEVRFVR
jgi:hypothetical protein